ncbi:hypothetical protein GCM10010231_02720 [Streptomyces sindenensis]|nr:hypothetical protein GCM10010231_02720 [Streptomyces sindenensis]
MLAVTGAGGWGGFPEPSSFPYRLLRGLESRVSRPGSRIPGPELRAGTPFRYPRKSESPTPALGSRVPVLGCRDPSVGTKSAMPLADLSIAVAMAGLVDMVVRVFVRWVGDVMKFDMGASVLARLLSDSQDLLKELRGAK